MTKIKEVIKPCHICKVEAKVTKQTVTIELRHEVAVPLTMTVPVCGDCLTTLNNAGIQRTRNTRLVVVA